MARSGWRSPLSRIERVWADQLRHPPRRVERRRRVEDHAQALPGRAERLDVIGKGLVFAPVALVLGGVSQKIAVKLLDVVFGEIDRLPAFEDGLHRARVPCHLLLVARREGFDLDPGKQPLDLAVAEHGSLDPGRGADAFDGGDPSQAGEPFGRDTPDGLPGALELIDVRDQPEDFVGDLQRGYVDGGIHFFIRFHPFPKRLSSLPWDYPFVYPFSSDFGKT